VVGNPPYVRHELIDDPLGWLPPGEYRQTVARSLGQRLSGAAELHDAGACLDTRCDLSALFLAHGLSLLKPDGAMALVIPSALFQARYGSAVLQLLRRSNRDAILAESFTHRSFAGAEVNTSVLLVTPQRLGPAGNRLQRVDVEGRPSELHASLVWQAAGRTSISSGGRNAIPRPVRLGDLGRLRYPIKTGLNAFFYLRPEAITSFEIEPRYCRPVLKSPRQVGCISLHPRVLPTMAFVCTDDPTTMGCGAARYVAWGAGQKTIRGDFWSQAPSVRGRRWWYTLPLPPPADILCPRFFDRRLFVVLPCEQVLEDQTFYGLILAPPLAGRRELIGALLNSSPACLMLEQHGRTGLGDGARQYALCDLADLPIPDPNRVPDALVEPIVAAFRRMAARRILPVAEEMRQSDRLALDALVGEALAIPDGRAAEIREETVRLVERRLARACRRHD
jgi:hypothetical protein